MSAYPSRVRFGRLSIAVAAAGLAASAGSISLGEEAQLPAKTDAQPVSSRHVVIVVWDGMRPDLVTPENAPALSRMAAEGVTFRHHHAVYLSATHVNGTAIETGMYPEHSGLIANYDYRPGIEKEKFVSTEQAGVIRKGDEISHGRYLTVPTLAELVRRAGGRTAVAAAKPVGVLLDRQPDGHAAAHGVTLSAGDALPAAASAPIVSSNGFFPGFGMYTHAQRDEWTTAALTQSLWKEGVPTLSILWLSEPDMTQHELSPGAPPALAAIQSSDRNLANVLAALEKKGVRDSTDVFVVSDHGFSTIDHPTNVQEYLVAAGLKALVDFKGERTRGDILMVGNGGSVLFYVVGHDAGVKKRLVEALEQSPFAGVLFTRDGAPGTFPLAKAQIDTPQAPDVVMAFRWTDEKNQFGVPGMIESDWNRQSGKGTHATLSRFDMHNTLIAAGPDFRHGEIDDLPTGNVDLAPTILSILKIKSPQPMDGRVVREAMLGGVPPEKAVTETIEASRQFPTGMWQQSLQESRVGTTAYLDEGNGGYERKDF
jgi:arylsulfatase A-like enzyme